MSWKLKVVRTIFGHYTRTFRDLQRGVSSTPFFICVHCKLSERLYAKRISFSHNIHTVQRMASFIVVAVAVLQHAHLLDGNAIDPDEAFALRHYAPNIPKME